jgi:hypothetical protein
MSTLTYSHPRARKVEATAAPGGPRIAELSCAGLPKSSLTAENLRIGRKNNEQARLSLRGCCCRLRLRIGDGSRGTLPSGPIAIETSDNASPGENDQAVQGTWTLSNSLAISPQGLWIGQQKISAQQAALWHEPVPIDRDETAWLVDGGGKLLKTVVTQSRNTSADGLW